MRKIFIVNHYASLPGEPGGLRHWNMAKSLHESGWDPEIVLANRIHNSNKLRRKDRSNSYQPDLKLKYIWVPSYRKNDLCRFLGMIIFSIQTFIYLLIRAPKGSVVIGSTIHPLAALAAMMSAKIRQAVFIFEIRDLWPETLIQFGSISKMGLTAKVLFAIERLTWINAKAIISPLAGVCEYGINRGLPKKEFLYLPNSADVKSVLYREPEDSAPRRLIYCGAIGEANELQVVIKAFGMLLETEPKVNTVLDIFGDGPARPIIERMIDERVSDRIHLHAPIPRDEILSQISASHGCILPLRSTDSLWDLGVSPNKLIDYLTAGRPVLTSLNVENGPIRDGYNGKVFSQTIQSWYQGMYEFSNLTTKELVELSKNARFTAISEFDLSLNMRRLQVFLEKVAELEKF